MTIKSTKILSPHTRLTLYFLYICLLLTCLCCLTSCTETKSSLSSHDKESEEVVLPDSDPRVVANTPSHVLANRLGNKLYRQLNGEDDPGKKEEDFTPLQSTSDSGTQFTPLSDRGERIPRFGEATNYASTEDTRLVSLQARKARKVFVTCTVRVFKLLKDDLKGRKHQRFLVKLSNNSTVLVAHNLNLAPKVPINVGDIVEISGEYIWNEKGGVLHYTHHTTNRRKLGGYIKFKGKKYR